MIAALVVGIYLHFSAGKTPTPAPVTVYSGTSYSLVISQTDLDQATGNTSNNNTVYFIYVNVLGETITSLQNTAGTFNNFCVKAGTSPNMYYYTDNVQRATISSYINSGISCGQ